MFFDESYVKETGNVGLSSQDTGNNLNSFPTEYAKVDFFKILYTNVDSLINKIDELKLLIKQEEPHLVPVTEILPKNSVYPVQEQELQIDGFNIVSNLEVANQSKLRGILLYIKSNYSYTVRKIDYQFQEHIFLDEITNTGSVFPLGLIYRSPNSSNQNNSLLLDTISDICLKTKEKLIILGDFNLLRINWTNMRAPHNSYEDSFLCCLLDNFLYQHVLEPTSIRSGQNENILGLVLTKEEDYINDLDFMNSLGKSDHLVLRIVLNEPIKHLVTCQRKK